MFRAAHPKLQALRRLLLLGSSVMSFHGVQAMPVPEFTAIEVLMPVLVTLMPFVYLQIGVAATISGVAFKHAPDGNTGLGLAVLSDGGALSAWLNVREAQARPTPESAVLRDTIAD